MAAGDKVYIADKQTVDDINSKVGQTGNTGGTTSAGTIFGKLNAIISSIANHIASWTAARAAKVDNLDTAVSSRESEADAVVRYSNLNTNTGINNTASATGTLSQKLSHIINTVASRESDADAVIRYSNLNTNTGVNNTASATGTLSQKLSHIINLFSTNKQKHLASKTVSVNVSTTGTHTLLNITGPGQFFVAYVNYMGDNYAAITFEIDGVPYTYREYTNSSYYIAQTIRFPSKVLDFFSSYTDNAQLMIPIYFTQSFKVTVNVTNAASRAFAAQYAIYE